MDIKYYFKLYTKDHDFIDELYIFSGVEYTKTLNGIGNMTFNIPINYLSQKEIELCLGQHIELYMIKDHKEQLLWYGVVNSPAPSQNDINCTCLGYASLLQNRNFTYIELDSENEWKKTYYSKTYGNLIFTLINEINKVHPTGIYTYSNQDTNLVTDRVINWDDDLYEKIQEFIEDSNCYFTIDENRRFNFYKSLGENKNYYEITDYNILGNWDYTIDQTQIYNVINSRIFFEETIEGQDEPVQTILTSHAEDINSINMYGRREKVCDSSSDIKLQETLDAQVSEELETYKDPLVSCNVKVGISDVFNIFDIEPGDYITLNSAEKQINQSIKVLEYTVNLTDNNVSISLGNSIFREVMPKIYRFK